jgi:hypothetical protein
MAIINAQLKTTPTDIFDPTGVGVPVGSVPTGKSYAITNILVCNTNLADDATFDMHLIPSGDPLDNAVTAVVRSLTLPPGETFTFDSERIVLEEGDKVTFVATPDIGGTLTNLAATVSYLEV